MARYTWAYLQGQGAARLPIPTGDPTVVLVGVTNHCNLRCDSCFQADTDIPKEERRPRGRMSWERFEKVVEQSRGLTTYLELGLFGEPTLHPELPRMVRYAVDAGLSVGVVTNGTLLDDDKARALVDGGPSAISFSVDGTNPAEFERLRVGARWKTVAAAIESTARARERSGQKRPLLVARGIAVSEDRAAEVSAQARRLRDLGVDIVLSTTPHNWSGSLRSPQGSIVTPVVPEQTALCPYPWLMLTVDWDGSIGPCCADFHVKNRLAAIDDSTLEEAWRGRRAQNLREAHRSRERGRIERETGCAGCSMLSAPTLDLSYSVQLVRQVVGEFSNRFVDAPW
jgi:radical SAM protein with 4Fe4S-binding SPASM domain